MKSKSSPSKKNPPPAGKEREAHDPSKMQLQIVDTRPTSSMIRSSVELPRGWVVEQWPRVNSVARPGRVDKVASTSSSFSFTFSFLQNFENFPSYFLQYYYEPGSGRQFRSLTAVQEYLCGEMEYTRRPPRVKPGNETSQIVPHLFRSVSPLMLLHDWIVEEKPRDNVRYAGVIDRYYIGPGTGQRFRSVRSVERYLSQMEASGAACEVLKGRRAIGRNAFLMGTFPYKIVWKYPEDAKRITTPGPSGTPGSRKKLKSAVEVDPMLDFTSPPAKVKWVLGGPGESLWNPFILSIKDIYIIHQGQVLSCVALKVFLLYSFIKTQFIICDVPSIISPC
ncbi:methyl-CpG-binding domain-containing protein 7 [Herrania umbratica]|uniref:Methyl-CpG-binding domain-containing protein 7 n=1 Tax=Herrania umbratica TaxID=108875 RepID=A0A6J0ZVU5_9ROSI|nr:methyl-CpG-binding domain-containing protein 7 [Herrania umbratica]